jgi:hypothetical protein
MPSEGEVAEEKSRARTEGPRAGGQHEARCARPRQDGRIAPCPAPVTTPCMCTCAAYTAATARCGMPPYMPSPSAKGLQSPHLLYGCVAVEIVRTRADADRLVSRRHRGLVGQDIGQVLSCAFPNRQQGRAANLAQVRVHLRRDCGAAVCRRGVHRDLLGNAAWHLLPRLATGARRCRPERDGHRVREWLPRERRPPALTALSACRSHLHSHVCGC